ncbi:hypothetical protein NDU88_000597 [Pleurodeles waltl]|uniref:Secreted protein n=1 Tax=Pleurodeles waltl TaxID=8319 RepID=A0AAV7U4F7_PLEWA|nr:hypothetical protein NDU88_000597 [Pleurodeles waltl]
MVALQVLPLLCCESRVSGHGSRHNKLLSTLASGDPRELVPAPGGPRDTANASSTVSGDGALRERSYWSAILVTPRGFNNVD